MGQTAAVPALLVPVELKRHQKVRAWTDLPGVPAGTRGKVLQVGGVTWIRYRVLFANGVEQGLLDGRHVVAREDYVPFDDRVEPEVAEDTAVEVDADAPASAAAVADNPFGIPAHLIERSLAARARHSGSG